jgi:hypothetical protein
MGKRPSFKNVIIGIIDFLLEENEVESFSNERSACDKHGIVCIISGRR